MKLFALTALLICSSLMTAQAQQETHGGDGFATEFFRIYSELRTQIPQEKIPLADGRFFSVDALDKVRPQLTVVSSPKVIWKEKEVSARNTPAKSLIELSQDHWTRFNYEQKISLVLHEVLPIAGWIDDDYAISSTLLKQINIQQAKISLKTIANALLACNTHVLQSVSIGQYQSFIQETRTELIHLSVISSCEYFLRKTMEFSSLSEVQTACESGRGNTPFETLVEYAFRAPAQEHARFMGVFNLLYTRPEDRKLFCQWGNKVEPRGTMCEVLQRKQALGEDELLKKFSAKMDCR